MRKVTKIDENRPNLTKMQKLRTAAYARVSTDSDEQLISLQAQKRHYESYIKANSNWEFVGMYFDEGISGTKKEKRTELLRLLKDCENRKIDFIITKSISRFARNTTDCLEIVRRLTELGIYIFFEKENINTQSMDSELMLTILSSLAESESVSISQNSKWSITKRFKNGTYKLGCPPYGYDLADGKLTPNSEQAPIVRRIFAEALSGKGAAMVAAGLNADGIKSQRRTHWTATSIRGILVNEKYVGDALFQKTYSDDKYNRRVNYGEKDQYYIKDHHEAIIRHADFAAAASILEQFGKEKGISKGATKYQNRYVFSSKIRCGECGSTFKRRIHKAATDKYVAWCCSKHIESVNECSMLFIRDEQVKQAFVTMINKLYSGHSYILKPLIQDLKSLENGGVFAKVQELEAKIEENTERRQVLTGLMTKGYLDPALFNAQKNALDMEAEKLKEQKKALAKAITGDQSAETKAEELLKYLNKMDGLIEQFDEAVFGRFIHEIVVFSSTEIGFRLNCGLLLKERLVR